jgi:hypothetical protein
MHTRMHTRMHTHVYPLLVANRCMAAVWVHTHTAVRVCVAVCVGGPSVFPFTCSLFSTLTGREFVYGDKVRAFTHVRHLALLAGKHRVVVHINHLAARCISLRPAMAAMFPLSRQPGWTYSLLAAPHHTPTQPPIPATSPHPALECPQCTSVLGATWCARVASKVFVRGWAALSHKSHVRPNAACCP